MLPKSQLRLGSAFLTYTKEASLGPRVLIPPMHIVTELYTLENPLLEHVVHQNLLNFVHSHQAALPCPEKAEYVHQAVAHVRPGKQPGTCFCLIASARGLLAGNHSLHHLLPFPPQSRHIVQSFHPFILSGLLYS